MCFRLFPAAALLALVLLAAVPALGQTSTYCNPLNLDYGYTPIPNFSTQGRHRATADPVIVNFRGTFYLFSTNQWGYWHSEDLSAWTFVPHKFLLPRDAGNYDELCAPAAFVMRDSLYVIGSTHQPNFPIWVSGDPKADQWRMAVDSFRAGAWDPAFHYEEATDQLFVYWGSSNEWPLFGAEVDPRTLQPTGFTKPLLRLHPEEHGWERFGEYNDNTFLPPFIEGAWVTKHAGKYYLQYAAPGTEFSGYADGVFVSDRPLEGFRYQSHNPFAYKPGGFARGAGHGATFADNAGAWWHVSTVVLGVKNNFERRLGLWPTYFDADGVMWANTAYGDYPTYLPKAGAKTSGTHTGWMLLNYQKPVRVSSTLGGYQANFAVDEDLKTYWSAASAGVDEWIETDLGEVATVRAIQINYADQDADVLGKPEGRRHRYRVLASTDAKTWRPLVDKSANATEVPHDYVELAEPARARYLRLENVAMPTGKFAISGLRVFGVGSGPKPDTVEQFIVLRAPATSAGERRSSWLKWAQNDRADGYVIYFGKAPDKLYGSIMVYGKNDYYFTGMDRADAYYFQIEAFNAARKSARTGVVRVE